MPARWYHCGERADLDATADWLTCNTCKADVHALPARRIVNTKAEWLCADHRVVCENKRWRLCVAVESGDEQVVHQVVLGDAERDVAIGILARIPGVRLPREVLEDVVLHRRGDRELRAARRQLLHRIILHASSPFRNALATAARTGVTVATPMVSVGHARFDSPRKATTER